MRRLLLSVAMLAASVVVVDAQGHATRGGASGNHLSGSVHVVFSTEDVRVIREYYTPRYRSLPPGLQKKYARTGQLPPGWQKKLEPLDPVVERRLVALPAGSDDDDYLLAFDEFVEPAVRAFEPELVLVSAGFDAHVADPLAGMHVTAEGFRRLARRSAALAPRTAAVLEGGYDVRTLPTLVQAALEGFGE